VALFDYPQQPSDDPRSLYLPVTCRRDISLQLQPLCQLSQARIPWEVCCEKNDGRSIRGFCLC
jgi:hypothetical protein